MPLLLDGLVSNKDGPDRGTDAQAAAVMMQTVQAVAGNPELAQQVGSRNLLQLLTRAARMGGAPRDFELELAGGAQTQPLTLEQVQKLIQEQGQQMMQQIGKEVADHVVKPAAEQDAKQEQQIQQVASQLATVEQVVSKLTQIFSTATTAPPPPSPVANDNLPIPPEAGQVPAGPIGQPEAPPMAGPPGAPVA